MLPEGLSAPKLGDVAAAPSVCTDFVESDGGIGLDAAMGTAACAVSLLLGLLRVGFARRSGRVSVRSQRYRPFLLDVRIGS